MTQPTAHMRTFLAVLSFLTVLLSAAAEQPYLVLEGQPRGEIVIAESPPRSVQLAAWESQLHLRKISGATLPIVHEPSESVVPIYIGASAHTEQLGITNEGLEAGAYRIGSGVTDPHDPWSMRENLKHVAGPCRDYFQPGEPFADKWYEPAPPMFGQAEIVASGELETAAGMVLPIICFGPVDNKTRLTLAISLDDGKTWPIIQVIDDGSAANLALVALPDHHVGVLYERDKYRRLSFQRVDLTVIIESETQIS